MREYMTRLNHRVERWLCRPEPNAAANQGIFRVLFCLFYLWQISDYLPVNLNSIPMNFRSSLVFTRWLPDNPPLIFLHGLNAVLVAGLIFLLAGYYTRLSTAVVLVAGLQFESLFGNADLERGTVFLCAYIPFFMLVFGDWGAKYSLDALLRRRAGAPEAVLDSSPRFVLPAHVALVVLAFLFCDAGVLKVLNYPVGFGQHHYMGHLFLMHRIDATLEGIPPVPFANLMYNAPALDLAARWIVIAFELAFPLALSSPRLRSFLVASALFFHSVNGIWLFVTFTSLMVVYGLFIDWAGLLARLRIRWHLSISIPSAALKLIAVGGAILIAVLWVQTRLPQQIISLGHRIDGRTIWFPVLPIAIAWWPYAAWSLMRGSRSRD